MLNDASRRRRFFFYTTLFHHFRIGLFFRLQSTILFMSRLFFSESHRSGES